MHSRRVPGFEICNAGTTGEVKWNGVGSVKLKNGKGLWVFAFSMNREVSPIIKPVCIILRGTHIERGGICEMDA